MPKFAKDIDGRHSRSFEAAFAIIIYPSEPRFVSSFPRLANYCDEVGVPIDDSHHSYDRAGSYPIQTSAIKYLRLAGRMLG